MKIQRTFEEAAAMHGWVHFWLAKDGTLWSVRRHEESKLDFGFDMDDMVVHEGYTAVQYLHSAEDLDGAIAITTFKVDRPMVEDLLSYLTADQNGYSTIAIKQVRGFAYTEFTVDEFRDANFKIPRSNWGMLMGRRNPKSKPKRRKFSVPEKHQRKIARSTLRMATPMVGVMGGMTKEEAREVLRRRNPTDYWRPKHVRMEERGAYVEDDSGAVDFEQCPVCGGEAQFMGTLGKTDWFRCRQCGMDLRRQSNPASVAQDVVAVYSTKGGAYQLVVVVEFDGCYGIQYIDHQKHTGGSAGLCDQRALNDKLTELIYWADRIDGIKYDLVYQRPASRPMYGMNPR